MGRLFWNSGTFCVPLLLASRALGPGEGHPQGQKTLAGSHPGFPVSAVVTSHPLHTGCPQPGTLGNGLPAVQAWIRGS